MTVDTRPHFTRRCCLSIDGAGYKTFDEPSGALATHLRHVVRFDRLGVVLVDPDTGAERILIIEPSNLGPVPPFRGTLDDLPARLIAGAAGVAARLGLKRTTLHSKLRRLGINRPGFDADRRRHPAT